MQFLHETVHTRIKVRTHTHPTVHTSIHTSHSLTELANTSPTPCLLCMQVLEHCATSKVFRYPNPHRQPFHSPAPSRFISLFVAEPALSKPPQCPSPHPTRSFLSRHLHTCLFFLIFNFSHFLFFHIWIFFHFFTFFSFSFFCFIFLNFNYFPPNLFIFFFQFFYIFFFHTSSPHAQQHLIFGAAECHGPHGRGGPPDRVDDRRHHAAVPDPCPARPEADAEVRGGGAAEEPRPGPRPSRAWLPCPSLPCTLLPQTQFALIWNCLENSKKIFCRKLLLSINGGGVE